jgi:hypothetical protein
MASLPARDLRAEVEKHFKGTPEERFQTALRLGRDALEAFLATLPPGTTPGEARETLRRNKHRGRRPSRLMEAPRR